MAKWPLISCLMVTQSSRLRHARRAIMEFGAQTYPARELIVVVDADRDCHTRLEGMFAETGLVGQCIFVEQKTSLGNLRNISLEAARGEIVCQWDDDDRYAPMRLALQAAAMAQTSAEAGFLTDQLHYFGDTGTLYWMDWCRGADGTEYPAIAETIAVPGTLMAHRHSLPRYPDEPIGEDSMLIDAMGPGRAIELIPLLGWTYLKIYHGENSWDRTQNTDITDKYRWRLTANEAQDWADRIREEYGCEFDLTDSLSGFDLPAGTAVAFG